MKLDRYKKYKRENKTESIYMSLRFFPKSPSCMAVWNVLIFHFVASKGGKEAFITSFDDAKGTQALIMTCGL